MSFKLSLSGIFNCILSGFVFVQASEQSLERYRHLVYSGGSIDTGADVDILRNISIVC